jgi:hypothetical protein
MLFLERQVADKEFNSGSYFFSLKYCTECLESDPACCKSEILGKISARGRNIAPESVKLFSHCRIRAFRLAVAESSDMEKLTKKRYIVLQDLGWRMLTRFIAIIRL